MKTCLLFFCAFLLLSSNIYSQDFEIKIDGEKDEFYNSLTGPSTGRIWLPPEAFNNNGPMPDDEVDLSANWYSAWDQNYLYVYTEVFDYTVMQDNGSNYWANDCFDAKIDPDVNSTAVSEVFCFAMTAMDSVDVDESMYGGISNIVQVVGGGWTGTERPTSEDYSRMLTDNGYILECRVKWDWITTASKGPIVPEVGNTFGFAVAIHDNDEGATRNNSIQWAAMLLDNVWSNCTNMGYIELLADHKMNYVPESLRDPSIINSNPDMYNPPATDVDQQKTVVKSFALSQNYPNPFNPSTTISYTVPKMSEVKISIYDLLGNELAILTDGMKAAGTYVTKFDGANLSSGIYFYKLQSEAAIITKKMLLLK